MVLRKLLILILFAVPSLVQAQAYKTESGHVEFHSEVPLHSFTGTSEHLVGLIDLGDSTVDFYIDLTTLDTGIDKRDKDMRNTLDTDQYPFAEFFGKLVSDFDRQVDTPQPATVRGKFTLHGISREIEVNGTLQNTSGGLEVHAEWTVNIEDYDIKPPGILFYRVDKNQDVIIDALLTPTETDKTN
ncbi:MAG: YceI family protein [Balneolaceae bacterium]|nr:YceI family protein [Balneolaceae bacterium]